MSRVLKTVLGEKTLHVLYKLSVNVTYAASRYTFLNFKFLILNCNFYLSPTFIIKFYILLFIYIHLFI